MEFLKTAGLFLAGNINVIMTVGMILFILGTFAWCVVWGFLRGTLRSATRLLTVAVSFFVAVIGVVIVDLLIMPLLQNPLVGLVEKLAAIISEITAASPALEKYLYEILTAMINPALYVLLFFTCVALTWCVYIVISVVLFAGKTKIKHDIAKDREERMRRKEKQEQARRARERAARERAARARAQAQAAYDPYGYAAAYSTPAAPAASAPQKKPEGKKKKRYKKSVGATVAGLALNITSRFGGAAVSVAAFLIIMVSVMVPVTGYVQSVANVYTAAYDTVAEFDIIPEEGYAKELTTAAAVSSDKVNRNFLVKATSFLGGKLFFGWMTAAGDSNAADELVMLANTVGTAIPAVEELKEKNPMEEITAGKAQLDLSPLEPVLASVEGSETLRTILSQLLSGASGNWKENEPFIGINLNEMLGDYGELITPIYDTLAEANADNLMTKFDEVTDGAEMLSETLVCVMGILEETPADQIAEGKAQLDLSALDPILEKLDDSEAGNYGLAKLLLANVLQSGATKWQAGESYLGIDMKGMLGEVGDSADAVFELFAATTDDTVAGDLSQVTDGAELLSETLVCIKGIVEETPADQISSGEAVLDMSEFEALLPKLETSSLVKAVLADVLEAGGAKWRAGESYLGIDARAMFGDFGGSADILFEHMTAVTEETVMEDVEEFSNCAEDMSQSLVYFVEMREDNPTELISEGKQILNVDKLNNNILPLAADSELMCEIMADIAKDASAKWMNNEPYMDIDLKAMLGKYDESADTLLGDLSHTTPATVVADVSHTANNMVLLSRSYVYFVDLGDISKGEDILRENITHIFDNVNEDTSDILTGAVTEEVVNSNKLNESSATVVEIVKDSISNVSSIEDAEEKKKEAEALNQLLSYSAAARSETVEQEKVIESFLASSVLSDKVTNIVETNNNPETAEENKQQIVLNDGQKTALDATIDDKLAEDDALSEKDKAALLALKELFISSGGRS